MDDLGRAIGRREADRQTLRATARKLQGAAALAWPRKMLGVVQQAGDALHHLGFRLTDVVRIEDVGGKTVGHVIGQPEEVGYYASRKA